MCIRDRLKPYDDMSVEDINRFTKDDVVCALEMFNEDYAVSYTHLDVYKRQRTM